MSKATAMSAVLFMAPLILLGGTASAVSGSRIASLSNQQRAAAGLYGYTWNDTLASSAYAKAKDMCTKHYWAHNSPDGLTPWSFIKGAGYDYTNAGENLAADFSTDEGVVKGWMNSPAHKANLLHSEFKEIGVASLTCNLTGEQTTVVVAHFGARSASVPAPAKPSQPARQKATSAKPKSQSKTTTKATITKTAETAGKKSPEKPPVQKPAGLSFADVLLSMLFSSREQLNNLY